MLDVGSDVELQVVKSNMIFATDSFECDRTVSFILPATPNNNSIFRYANNINIDAADMVTNRIQSIIYCNSVSLRGYLYVSSCNESGYECVFVFGDLLTLKKIQELGAINTLISPTDIAKYGTNSVVSANTTDDILWVSAKYQQRDVPPYPSINVKQLLKYITNNIDWLDGVIDYESISKSYRIIPKKIQPETQCTFTMLGIDTNQGTFVVDKEYANFFKTVTQNDVVLEVHYNNLMEVIDSITGSYNMLYSTEDIKITFPDNTPIGCTIVTNIDLTDGVRNVQFLGDYSYDYLSGFMGTPLRGRTISINKNKAFMLYLFPDGFTRNFTPSEIIDYFNFIDATISVTVGITLTSSQAGSVPLKPYLPELTVIELCRAIAYQSGQLLLYSREGVLKWVSDDYFFLNIKKIDISDRVISIDDMQRVMSDFAQENTVTMDYADWASTTADITYVVDNKLIAEKKELYKIPFSNGVNHSGVLTLYDNNSDCIGVIDSKSDSLQSPKVGFNYVYEHLCRKKKQIKVCVRMPIYEWYRLTELIVFTIRGKNYTWVSLQWSNDIATMILQEI